MQSLPPKPRLARARLRARGPSVPDVEVDGVERRAQACRSRVGDDLGAGVQDLEPVRTRRRAELGAEIVRAEHKSGDAIHRADLVGERAGPPPFRRSPARAALLSRLLSAPRPPAASPSAASGSRPPAVRRARGRPRTLVSRRSAARPRAGRVVLPEDRLDDLRGRLPSRQAPCRPRGRRSPRPRRPRAPSGACAPPRRARRAATSVWRCSRRER